MLNKKNLFFNIVLFIISSLFFVNEVFSAYTSNANVNVFASVESNCSVSTTSLNFGSYNPAVDSLSTAVISMVCTGATISTLSFSAGAGASGKIASRTLKSIVPGSSHTLNYNIYTTSAHTTIFGDGVTAGSIISTKSETPLTIYGKLPAGQNVTSYMDGENFSDTIPVTITY